MPTSERAKTRLAELVDRCRVTDSDPLGVSLNLELTPADYNATPLPTAHEVMRAYSEKHRVKVNKLTDTTRGFPQGAPCLFCRREIPCECDAQTCMCSCGRCLA